MTFEMRLAMLRFDGHTDFGQGRCLYYFSDAQTGSTFAIEPGQCLGRALADFALRWEAAERRVAEQAA